MHQTKCIVHTRARAHTRAHIHTRAHTHTHTHTQHRLLQPPALRGDFGFPGARATSGLASEVHLSLLSPQVKPRRSPFPRNPRPALPGRRLPGPPKGAPKQRSCLGGKPRARHGSGAQPALKPRVTGKGGLPDRSPLTFLILVKHRGLVGVVPAHIPPRRLPLLHARPPECGARRAGCGCAASVQSRLPPRAEPEGAERRAGAGTAPPPPGRPPVPGVALPAFPPRPGHASSSSGPGSRRPHAPENAGAPSAGAARSRAPHWRPEAAREEEEEQEGKEAMGAGCAEGARERSPEGGLEEGARRALGASGSRKSRRGHSN